MREILTRIEEQGKLLETSDNESGDILNRVNRLLSELEEMDIIPEATVRENRIRIQDAITNRSYEDVLRATASLSSAPTKR